MISVTHGRPTMISSHLASAVPLQEQSKHLPFFANSLELYEIINQIILKLYSTDSAAKDKTPALQNSYIMTDNLITALKLDSSLNRIEKNFPSSVNLEDPIAHRQAVIIRIRLLHARILLLRPILAEFCLSQDNREKSSTEETLSDRMIEQCALECVAAAQKLILVTSEHQRDDDSIGLLPAWWYRIFYVYTAATVLLAARLRRERFTCSSISEPWNRAISILQSHERFGVSARRCVAALQILSSKVFHGPSDTTVTTGDHVDNQTFSPDEAFNINPQISLDGIGFDADSFGFDIDNYQWLNSMPGGIMY
ncbi:uncharacterized protein F4822DRAFT_445442, partial [Hypoxylon trugodes]|uniref:uncharacterized protein n=1 Tax=Hypoxylon trugodes TaxID=326681 RepID=UPI00219061C5